ncbi:MAG: hypothetical protein ABSD74_13880 [Rhizomicrobium sp.]|jgi:hypothetical protein
MGSEHLKLGVEFSMLAAVFAAVFVWGLATGKTAMKAPLSAVRSTEPVKYWMGQTLFGSSCLLCLYAAVAEMPPQISIWIIAAH